MADALVNLGQEALLRGEFEKAQWSLNAALYLKNCSNSSPVIEDSSLWQRGLSSYYACNFKEGQIQFECDMSTNAGDVEETVWHFLCHCNTSGFQASLDHLMTKMLPSSQPSVPPMPQVLELFKGTGSPKAVLMSATSIKSDGNKDGSPVMLRSYNNTNALAYAHFYIGMYSEVLGEYATAKHHFQVAAELKNPDFMGGLMHTHFNLFCRRFPPRFYSTCTVKPASGVLHKIIHGGWQISEGHLIQHKQNSNPVEVVRDLLQVLDSGIRVFDCGDIYVGVEEVYGQLIKAHCSRGGRRNDITIHSKLVPDLTTIQNYSVDRLYVESVVRRTLNRLGVKCVELVQFHWWDTSVSGYVEALNALCDLARQGLVKKVGINNFDTETTKSLLDAGIPIASTQVYRNNSTILMVASNLAYRR